MQINNRVMALNSCYNFVSAHYFKNERILTNSVINMGILMCYDSNLDFVNISASINSGRLSLGRGHLCHIDTFLVFSSICIHCTFRGFLGQGMDCW